MTRCTPRHVFDRHGLWEIVRATPPHNEFGPTCLLGLFQMYTWHGGMEEIKDTIRRATRRELATWISLCGTIGAEVVAEGTGPAVVAGLKALMPPTPDFESF